MVGDVATSAQLALLNGPGGMNASQFMSTTGVTSAELARYQTDGKLNQQAYELLQYMRLSPEDRQVYEQALMDAGLMTSGSATGVLNSSLPAVKQAIALSGAAGQTLSDWLQTKTQNGIAGVQLSILNNTNTAEKGLENQAPVAVSLTNPTSLDAGLVSAWTQALGYAPTQDQENAFIAAYHAQETTYAEAGNATTKANDQAIINNSKQETAELSALGSDGVTMFVNLYQHALGQPLSVPGSQATPVAQLPYTQPQQSVNALGGLTGTTVRPTPGVVPPNMQARYGPGHPPPPESTSPGGLPPGLAMPGVNPGQGGPRPGEGVIGGLLHAAGDVVGGAKNAVESWLHPTDPTTAYAEAKRVLGAKAPGPEAGGMTGGRPMSNVPAGQAPAVGSGLFMLTPALWKEALSVYGQSSATISQYPTEGSAPIAVQQAAFTSLASHLFSQTNNWAQVTNILQTGSTTGTPTGTQASMASSINNQINTDIQNIQNQVNTQPNLVEKFTAPDATSEEAAAARASDPIGYTAANVSSAGAVLQSMLYGNPVSELQSTSDQFAGPVPPTATPASTTSTPSTAPTATAA